MDRVLRDIWKLSLPLLLVVLAVAPASARMLAGRLGGDPQDACCRACAAELAAMQAEPANHHDQRDGCSDDCRGCFACGRALTCAFEFPSIVMAASPLLDLRVGAMRADSLLSYESIFHPPKA